MPYFCTINCPKLQSFQMFRLLDPHQGSALDMLAGLQRPRPQLFRAMTDGHRESCHWHHMVKCTRYIISPILFQHKRTQPIFIHAPKSINPPKQNRKKCPKARPKSRNLPGLLHRSVTNDRCNKNCGAILSSASLYSFAFFSLTESSLL